MQRESGVPKKDWDGSQIEVNYSTFRSGHYGLLATKEESGAVRCSLERNCGLMWTAACRASGTRAGR